MDAQGNRRKSQAPKRTSLRKASRSLFAADNMLKPTLQRKSSETSIVGEVLRYFGDKEDDVRAENEQLSKIRDLNTRIAHRTAKRKSFSKVAQLRRMRVQLLGAREETPIEKKARKKLNDSSSMEDLACESLYSLSMSDNDSREEDFDECIASKLCIQEREELKQEKKYFAKWAKKSEKDKIDDYSKENAPILSSKILENSKRTSVKSTLNPKSCTQKSSLQLGRTRSDTFPRPEDTLRRKDGKVRFNSANNESGDAIRGSQRGMRLPNLIRSNVKVFGNVDGADRVVKNKLQFTNGNLTDRKIATQDVQHRNAFVKSPPNSSSVKMQNRGRNLSMDQKSSLPHLTTDKVNSRRKSANFDDDENRRQFTYQKKQASSFQERKVSLNVNQQQTNNISEEKSNRFDLPRLETSVLLKKRLSQSFRELESCRYLRIYRK